MLSRGGGLIRVLLVDDDPGRRQMARRGLERICRVLMLRSAPEACAVLAAHGSEFEAVVYPNDLDGAAEVRRELARRPWIATVRYEQGAAYEELSDAVDLALADMRKRRRAG